MSIYRVNDEISKKLGIEMIQSKETNFEYYEGKQKGEKPCLPNTLLTILFSMNGNKYKVNLLESKTMKPFGISCTEKLPKDLGTHLFMPEKYEISNTIDNYEDLIAEVFKIGQEIILKEKTAIN